MLKRPGQASTQLIMPRSPTHPAACRWWSQNATKRQGDRTSEKLLRDTWKESKDRPNVGGVSVRSRNGAPARKGDCGKQ